jgi:hypothetical protein
MLPLLNNKENGLNLMTNNMIIWIFPFISIVIGDWPECTALCTIYASVNCTTPCHEYLISNKDLNKIFSDNKIFYRTPILMYQAIRDGYRQEISIHNIDNIFWSYP